MKVSFYNKTLGPFENGNYLLFNTLTGSILDIDEELKSCLEKDDLSTLDQKALFTLEKGGIILDDMDDERRKLKVLYEAAKYGSGPLSFVIVPTYRCNMTCSYCYLGRGEILTKTMSDTVLNSVIAFTQDRIDSTDEKQLVVNFYGGEPLLESEKIFKFLSTLKPYVINNLISTNGTLLNEEVITKLKCYPTTVQVTLAGPRDIHDQKRSYKKGSGTYIDIIEGIHRLLNAKIYTNVRLDVDTENYEHLENLLDDLEDEGIKEGIVLSFERVAQVYYARNYPLCLPANKSILALWKMASDKGFKMRPSGPVSSYTFCLQQTSRAFTVDPLGDLYPCTGFLGDKKHRIGRIGVSGKIQKVAKEYYDWLSRDPLLMEKCRKCQALPLCCGGCAAKAYQKHKRFHEPFCGEFGDPNFLEGYLLQYIKQESTRFSCGQFPSQ